MIDPAKIVPRTVELHLNNYPEFVKKFGKRVRAVGGAYSVCRGSATARFVFLPVTEFKLINDAIKEFGPSLRTVVIARGLDDHYIVPAWVRVHYVSFVAADPLADFLKAFRSAVAGAAAKGLIVRRTGTDTKAATRSGPSPAAVIACEFGYKACEKGMNLQMALAKFQECYEGRG